VITSFPFFEPTFSHKSLYNWADPVDFYWKKPV
jgi:hypothetical protein